MEGKVKLVNVKIRPKWYFFWKKPTIITCMRIEDSMGYEEDITVNNYKNYDIQIDIDKIKNESILEQHYDNNQKIQVVKNIDEIQLCSYGKYLAVLCIYKNTIFNNKISLSNYVKDEKIVEFCPINFGKFFKIAKHKNNEKND